MANICEEGDPHGSPTKREVGTTLASTNNPGLTAAMRARFAGVDDDGTGIGR